MRMPITPRATAMLETCEIGATGPHSTSENKNAQHVGPGEVEGTKGAAQIPGPLFDVDRIQVVSGRVVLLCIVVSDLSAICDEVAHSCVALPLTKKEGGLEIFFGYW